MKTNNAIPNAIPSSFWREEPEEDNPFAAKACFCHGFDVYGDLLGKISWIEYLFLLISGKVISEENRRLFEVASVAIANPGPRDPSVRGAMNAAIGGSQQAAGLMASLAIGAGQNGGAHEVFLAVSQFSALGHELAAWDRYIQNFEADQENSGMDAWLPQEHIPGFDPHGTHCATPVMQLLSWVCDQHPGPHTVPHTTTHWLNEHRGHLEKQVGHPLAMTGLISAIFHDLGLSPSQAEMLYLMLRLPGAAAHALDQSNQNFRTYPFFSIDIKNDPGAQ